MSDHRHLVVIGAQRSGTTLLARLLAQHPEVCTAEPARPEPKVFCSDELTARGHGWYDATWFGHASGEALYAEKSTSYLEDPQAPARVLAMLGPDAMALVQLRDPVERAVSNWRFSTDHGVESASLGDALEADLEGEGRPWDRRASSVSPFAYVRRGRYADYLGPWLESFGERLVVSFLDEVAASEVAVTALYESLGLAAFAPVSLDPVNASTVGATLDPQLLARLRDHYAETDDRLAEMLGRALPWRRP